MPITKTARERKPAAAAGVHVHVGGTPPEDGKPETADSPDVEALDEALAQLPENTIAKVYRLRDDGQKAFVFQGAPAAVTEQRVAKCGPGDYVVVFWGPLGDGTRKNGYKGSKRVYIAPNAEDTPPSPPVTVGFGGADMISTTFLAMLQQMQQQSREHSAGMTALLTKLAAPQERDPIMTLLLTKMLESNKVDPIEQAARIAEINTKVKGGNATAEVLATLELIERLKALGSDGNADGEHWAAQIAKHAIPHLLRQREPEPSPEPRRAPNPPVRDPNVISIEEARTFAAGNTNAVSSGAAMPNAPPYLLPIVPFLPWLVTAATMNWEPSLVADMICASVDPEHLAPILAAPTHLADIMTAEPRLQPWAAWLQQVRDETVHALTDDDDSEPGGDNKA